MENPKYLVEVRYSEVTEFELFETLEGVMKFMNANGSFNLDFVVYEVGKRLTYKVVEIREPQPPKQVEILRCVKDFQMEPAPDKVTRTHSSPNS
jgi:hypothetical protein